MLKEPPDELLGAHRHRSILALLTGFDHEGHFASTVRVHINFDKLTGTHMFSRAPRIGASSVLAIRKRKHRYLPRITV